MAAELGSALFPRTKKGASLTPAGRTSRLYALAGPGYPLPAQNAVAWEELFAHPVVVRQPQVMARILPDFRKALGAHQWSEQPGTPFPLQQPGAVILSYGRPLYALPADSARPVAGATFGIYFLTRQKVRPAVMAYMDFMRAHYQRLPVA